MTKCKGCGVTLQNIDENGIGYSEKLTNKLCERCFKIIHYNYHDEGKYINNIDICNGINQKDTFNFFMCDIFSLNKSTIELYEKIHDPKIFVLTKADIIPINISYEKLVSRIKNSYNLDNVILCSIKNNAGIDDIRHLINEHKNVLFCGPTSSGKSSLINFLFDYELTTSVYKNTTQEFITLETDGVTLVDAPGFICDVITNKSRLIVPKTMIINKDYELVIDDVVISFDREVHITLFFPKVIEIITRKKRENLANCLEIKSYQDMTIKNIGFIYFKNECKVYIDNIDDIFIRDSVVGGS